MGDSSGIFSAVKRIIAIGDVHGDYQQTIRSLQLAKVIKLNGSRWVWCGGQTYIIQLGDQIDRKARDEATNDEDSEIKIMKFFDYLDTQAQKDGGRVLSIIGNHESINVSAQFQYVSPKGLAHFGGAAKREEAFKPGGEMAKYMSEHRYAVIKVGAFIFVHGGATPRIVDKYTIPQVNKLCKDYLAGKIPKNREINELFENNESLLWTRWLAGPRPNCEKLDHVLKKWNGRVMVIGHTPQEEGITSACNNKVWRVDVGLSAAILGSADKAKRVQVLEITQNSNKEAKVIPLKFKEISEQKPTLNKSITAKPIDIKKVALHSKHQTAAEKVRHTAKKSSVIPNTKESPKTSQKSSSNTSHKPSSNTSIKQAKANHQMKKVETSCKMKDLSGSISKFEPRKKTGAIVRHHQPAK